MKMKKVQRYVAAGVLAIVYFAILTIIALGVLTTARKLGADEFLQGMFVMYAVVVYQRLVEYIKITIDDDDYL